MYLRNLTRRYEASATDFGTGAQIVQLETELDLLLAMYAGWMIRWFLTAAEAAEKE